MPYGPTVSEAEVCNMGDNNIRLNGDFSSGITKLAVAMAKSNGEVEIGAKARSYCVKIWRER
jgi:hypothetical protein